MPAQVKVVASEVGLVAGGEAGNLLGEHRVRTWRLRACVLVRVLVPEGGVQLPQAVLQRQGVVVDDGLDCPGEMGVQGVGPVQE